MPQEHRIVEVAKAFTRLGFTAFGGPAAHIAMMREEFVLRRQWLAEGEFAELIGVTNLIPGPNSTELAIHLGLMRAGVPGMFAAGLGFIMPARFILMGLAWGYQEYHSLPQVAGLLYGMKPVIAAVVFQALVGLRQSTLRSHLLASIAIVAAVLSYVGVPELPVVFVPGFVLAVVAGRKERRPFPWKLVAGVVGTAAFTVVLASLTVVRGPATLPGILVAFLKVGSVLYGSGYVLLSYLSTDLVTRLGWLSRTQLLDAISVGQFTPGPVFTTATFIGYLLGGVPGALIATVGIFLPSFIFVGLAGRGLGQIRESLVVREFLAGVTAASLGLMLTVALRLGLDSMVDPLSVGLGVVSLGLLLRFQVNSVWLVLVGGLAGVGFRAVGGW